ncbi:MAG: ChaN family lipoprotein [Pseudomonadota bacterium]
MPTDTGMIAADRRPQRGRRLPFIGPLVVVAFVSGACSSVLLAEGEGGEEEGVVQAVSLPGAGNPLAGVIWDVAAGQPVSAEALAARLQGADVAILGEIHDNALHHERQAEMVAAIAPSGLAFEMVPEASERGIAVFLETGGEPGAIGPAIGWERMGWPDWSIYRPIFDAAFEDDASPVITGGALPRASLGLAMREGAASAYGDGAVAAGLDRPLSALVQAQMTAEMIRAHCDLIPAEAAAPMVEVQRLRDARFAAAVLRARDRAPAGPTVLITGNGHARTDRGVPAFLDTMAPALSVLSLGQVEVTGDADSAGDYADQLALYDFVWFSTGVPGRGDPCDALRQRG